MVKRFFLLIFLLMTGSMPTMAVAGDGRLTPERNPEAEYQLSGDIIAIAATELALQTAAGERRWTLTGNTRFFCNGRPATWRALQPVAANAFFEGCLNLDERGEIRAIYGFYYGAECLITDFEMGQGAIRLHLTTVPEERRLICPVAPRARLPGDNHWLTAGETVFVLFNHTGAVRAVYWIH